MKFILDLALLLALGKYAHGAGVGTFFTYYEEGGLGPKDWALLDLDGQVNQCAGTQGRSGFGQSPIAITGSQTTDCDTDLQGYEFEAGSCEFKDLAFSISNNGVKVEPKKDELGLGSACNMGRMKIPGYDTWFNALQYHIHTSSEHTLDDKFYPLELHVVHQEAKNEGASFAVFGTMIDVSGFDKAHEDFDWFIQGWESVAQGVDAKCATEGKQSDFATVQEVVTCPEIGTLGTSRNLADAEGPVVDYPDGAINLYTSLPTTGDWGTFTYKGGLTTPPCSEIVNWNLLDRPMYVSEGQKKRLEQLILCFVDEECRHATVADQKGSTSRPPQPLEGRSLVHRCPEGPGTEVRDTVDPTTTDADNVIFVADDDYTSASSSFVLAAGAALAAAVAAIAQL